MKTKNYLALAFGLVALGTAPALADVVQGTTAGVFFDNPSPQPSGVVTSGSGSVYTYGTPSSGGPGANSLRFEGTSFTSDLNTPFAVGTLTYFNGTTNEGSTPTAVNLVLTTSFSVPALGAIPTAFTLSLNLTPNIPGDLAASADYVYFPSSFGTADILIGDTTYHLHLTGFGDVSVNGFPTSDNSQFHVLEGQSATATLYAEVTSAVPTVPEPSTWAMMILGFAGVGFMTYRRHRSAALAA